MIIITKLRQEICFLSGHWKRIRRAIRVFFLPSVSLLLLVYSLMLLCKDELFSAPPIAPDKDYPTILMAGIALFTALASVEAQIYTNLARMVDELGEKKRKTTPVVRAREFTWRGGWLFAAAVPPLLILLVIHVCDWNWFGIKTYVATLQAFIFACILIGWICLIAATLRDPPD